MVPLLVWDILTGPTYLITSYWIFQKNNLLMEAVSTYMWYCGILYRDHNLFALRKGKKANY